MVSAAAGTRAGNPLGDVLFNVIFAASLRAIRAELAREGLLVMLPPVSAAAVLARPADLDGVLAFSDVSYLDDATFCLWASTADEMHAALPRLVVIVRDTSLRFGFKLNFAAGKSEAIMTLTGKWSKFLRRQVFITGNGLVQCGAGEEAVQLRIVHAYTHLGAVVATGGDKHAVWAQRLLGGPLRATWRLPRYARACWVAHRCPCRCG